VNKDMALLDIQGMDPVRDSDRGWEHGSNLSIVLCDNDD
jgi:hypothetical protein